MSKLSKCLLILFLLIIGFTLYSWFATYVFKMSFVKLSLSSILSEGITPPNIRTYPFDIYIYYNEYPQYQNKIVKILAAILVGTVAFVAITIITSRSKVFLYGNSSFARKGELTKKNLLLPKHFHKRKGLFAGDRIIIGRYGSQFIALPGQMSVILAAMTRSGKGVGVVIPVLLSYAHSMIVNDIKGENFRLTSGFRQKCGHKIFKFNPFDENFNSSCWNPLFYIKREIHLRISDINNIALSLIPDADKDENGNFYPKSARELFIAIVLFLLDKEKNDGSNPSIKGVLDFINDPNLPLSKKLRRVINYSFVTDQTKAAISTMFSHDDKVMANIYSSVISELSLWRLDTVAESTSYNHFDLRDIRREKMTIYITIPPSKLLQASKLLNLFNTQYYQLNTEVEPADDSSLKYQALYLKDEATAAGRIAHFSNAIAYMASYGLRTVTVVQTQEQLKKTYGPEDAKILIQNHAARVIYGTKDYEIAEQYSKLCGFKTLKHVTSESDRDKGRRRSKTYTLNQKALLLPQDFMRMEFEEEILQIEGLKNTIAAEKIRYYQDPIFMPRVGYKPSDSYPKSKRHYLTQEDNQKQENSNSPIAKLQAIFQPHIDAIGDHLCQHQA